MKEFINIGKIINTHGIKGELKIYPLTDDKKRFKELKYIYIDGTKIDVLGCKIQNTKVILKIEGVNSIEEASKYKNKYIMIDRTQTLKLPEDRYFTSDIIGCKVLDTNGNEVGSVYRIIETGSNDVFWVKGHKEVLIPVINDVVLDINVDEETIIIKPVKEWNYED